MKEKNYNLELIRMISFIFVIVIHVSNYYCRAYGDITIGEYSFSLLLNLLARISVPCFFMITGALLLGRQESLHKHAKRIFRFLIVLLVWSVIYMINKMSWAFSVAEESYDRETHTRTILKIKKVYDVSAVSIPANGDTEISARAFASRSYEQERQELLKRRAAILKIRASL